MDLSAYVMPKVRTQHPVVFAVIWALIIVLPVSAWFLFFSGNELYYNLSYDAQYFIGWTLMLIAIGVPIVLVLALIDWSNKIDERHYKAQKPMGREEFLKTFDGLKFDFPYESYEHYSVYVRDQQGNKYSVRIDGHLYVELKEFQRNALGTVIGQNFC